MPTVTPKQKARTRGRHSLVLHVDTAHNTAAEQSRVVAVPDELDYLTVQGIPINTPTRKRVLQLGKSAKTTMAREAIQLETSRQLPQNSRKKGKGTGPGSQTALADEGTRLLTSEVAEDLKKKAEAKFEAELEAKLRLENKRKEKSLWDAMIDPPLGGLYEAAAVAEDEGETVITIDISLRWRVEAIKADYFVTHGRISVGGS